MRKKIFHFLGIILTTTLIFSCAQRGNPSGGPRDVLPPKFIASFPDTLSTNVDVNLKEIQIDFNEYLVLKDQNKQVVVSPPFNRNPSFQPAGTPKKYVKIELKEPLQPNTTYNFNFGNSIQDFNENNSLDGFKFVFSTGNYIDSLQITGKIKNTLEKEIPENVVVGLYKIDSTYSDSLLLNSKPYYISKLDSANRFNLNYLREGKYQIIAFNDDIPNLKLEPESEIIGFSNDLIDLNSNQTIDLQLFPQTPNYKVKEAKQTGFGSFVFNFQGNPEAVNIQPIEKNITTQRIDFKAKSDSVQYWYNPKIDSITNKKSETLKFKVQYKEQIDTVKFLYKNNFEHNLSFSEKNKSNYSPNVPFVLRGNYPLKSMNKEFINVIKDSVQLEFSPKLNQENTHEINLGFPIQFNSEYSVQLLPGAITDFFNETNDTINFSFKVKDEKQFGNLKLNLTNVPKKKFWLKMYNNQNKLINEFYGIQSSFDYRFLKPGEYYFKLLVDENENGFWDSGNFFQKKQPEKVYLYPTKITIRAFWDADETWVLN